MPINEGSNPGEYEPTVSYIQPGDPVDQTNLRDPSIDIETRTAVIRTFVETLELEVDAHIVATQDVHGVSGSLVTLSTSQTITNKEIINVEALELKKDNEANLATFATNNGGNSLCYATDTGKVYGIVSNALVELGGSSGASVPSVIPVITQVAHGFSQFKQLYFNGTSELWELGDSSSEASVPTHTVTSVVSADVFIVAKKGMSTKVAHGLTPGVIYYADPTSPGNLTSTLPVTGFVAPILVPITADKVLLNITDYYAAGATTYSLEDLSDVVLIAPAENETLIADPSGEFSNNTGYDVPAWNTHINDDSLHMQGGTLVDTIAAVQAVEIPVGALLPYVCGTEPSNFLEADGSTFSQGEYPELYTALGDYNHTPLVGETPFVGISSYVKAKSIATL